MSECGCIYVSDDGEIADFYNAREVIARKEHICAECHQKIYSGEKYEKATGKWDTLQTFKTCRHCLSIRDSFFCEGFLHTTIIDDLKTHIYDLGGQISSDCLTPLTRQAKNMVCDIIEKAWEKIDD